LSFHRQKVVSLNGINSNLHVLRNFTKKRIFPVLKGNAYGHGLSEVGKRIDLDDGEILCTATLDEALALKLSRPKARILFWLFSSVNELECAILNEIEISIGSMNQLEKVQLISQYFERPIRLHIEIDCGLNRGGFKILEINDLVKVFSRLKKVKNLSVCGVWAHVSNPTYASQERSKCEIAVFSNLLDLLEQGAFMDLAGLDFHLGGSGILGLVDDPRVNSMRVGLSLYGYSYSVEKRNQLAKELKICMDFSGKILFIKQARAGEFVGYSGVSLNSDRQLAVVGFGYGDGILKNAFSGLLVRNVDHEHLILNDPAMDQIHIDITGCNKCHQGDWISIFGPGEIQGYGLNYVWRNKFIPNEILSVIGSRVNPVYRD